MFYDQKIHPLFFSFAGNDLITSELDGLQVLRATVANGFSIALASRVIPGLTSCSLSLTL